MYWTCVEKRLSHSTLCGSSVSRQKKNNTVLHTSYRGEIMNKKKAILHIPLLLTG